MATQTQSTTRKANRYDRTKTLGALGYVLAESTYAKDLYFLSKPNGTRYAIDMQRETCDCPASVPDCAHILFVRRCLAFAAKLDKPTVTTPAPTTYRRPNRAVRRLAAWDRLRATKMPDKAAQATQDARKAYADAQTAKHAVGPRAFQASMAAEESYDYYLRTMARVTGLDFLHCRRVVEWGVAL